MANFSINVDVNSKSVNQLEEDLQKLNQIVLRKKMDELFEEPSTYEDEEDD